MQRSVAIIGGGISGLGAAWCLHHHPDSFDFRLYEANDQVGGNAMTVDMPQPDGSLIPFDIGVSSCIPSVYNHIVLLLEQFNIDLIDTRFSLSVQYGSQRYAHDCDTRLRQQLDLEITRFRQLLTFLGAFAWLTRSHSQLLNALNPFNYISMRTLLNLGSFSADFRYKILKPMFINFVMATNVFDLPASLFARYLEYFDLESATKLHTWDQGTRRIYDHLIADFQDKIYLNRPVSKVYRDRASVVIEDAEGLRESFDDVIFACNANQTLMMLDSPTCLERFLLSSVRYESELHNHAVAHSDSTVLPDDGINSVEMSSTHISQYGSRPDNYEITYIVHNQQPWARESEDPCLVTFNPNSPIDEEKVIKRWWFQHVVHDIRHVTILVPLFRRVQGRRRSWHCGAHVLINSQETCFLSGLAVATQLGADYPFEDSSARRSFNHYGRIMHGARFRKARS